MSNQDRSRTTRAFYMPADLVYGGEERRRRAVKAIDGEHEGMLLEYSGASNSTKNKIAQARNNAVHARFHSLERAKNENIRTKDLQKASPPSLHRDCPPLRRRTQGRPRDRARGGLPASRGGR
ncbi:hypothetical protein JB92DRAFT_749347 [Gautieria morchelliformis]|nr:hypothetical protein JB92DRAFT_749347 [Gautieria morchelliformis]